MLIAPPSAALLATWIVVPLALFACLCLWTKNRRVKVPASIEAAMAHRAAPTTAAIVASLLTWFVWGSLREPGVVHDEQAYLLQAEIFASGRWTGETPPVPEFFEQPHVFVEPALASKYPPGHSLLLVPGIWLGLPGLVPVLLAGVCGGLTLAIARRVSDPVVAILTWALSTASVAGLHWRASYLSQNTSAALWMLALWMLLKWRETGQGYALAAVVAALGWMGLTRPLTVLGVGIPIGIFVLMTARRRGRGRQIWLAASMLIPLLILHAVWQQKTVGDWSRSPYAEYSRQYFPFVRPGFGVDLTPPTRHPPPEIAWIGQQFLTHHAAHELSAIPLIILARLIGLASAVGQYWRAFLVVLFVTGLLRVRGPARFGLLSGAALMGAYLVYAHPAAWVIYYVEVFPVFFLVASLELTYLARLVTGGEGTARAAGILLVAAMMPGLATDVYMARKAREASSSFHRHALAATAQIPDRFAIVFVNHPVSPAHDESLIINSPDYRTARFWFVYDRGAENERLLSVSNRAAYRLSTAGWTLERLR